MKVKIFDIVLHNLPAGNSSATHLEEQINSFLKHYPNLQIVAPHMTMLVVRSDPVSQRFGGHAGFGHSFYYPSSISDKPLNER